MFYLTFLVRPGVSGIVGLKRRKGKHKKGTAESLEAKREETGIQS